MTKKMVYIENGMKMDNYLRSVLIKMAKKMVYIEIGMKTDNYMRSILIKVVYAV